MNNYTYLALGDSYTVGELEQLQKSFPYQVVQMLRQKGLLFGAPEIVAKTGWTTDELIAGIKEYHFNASYDVVTLLIGVNNQYRGRSVEEYEKQFEELLKMAIEFAGNKNDHVIVVSIPDYGVTPTGQSMDHQKIAEEIDLYNIANKKIADQYNVHYINITPGSKDAWHDPELVAEDKLHPSAKEYKKWAQLVSQKIAQLLV